MSELVWNKPVICIFKERDVNPEQDPFVVIKAKKVSISPQDSGRVTGHLQDFFTLMGDADYLSSVAGQADHYVMCWFDDSEPEPTRDLRRLRGVTLTGKVNFNLNQSGKRTYNAAFEAEHAKLK